MDRVVYEIVQHDGGWAYKVGATISETFPTRELAHAAADRVAAEQRAPGENAPIEYEDSEGLWHEEQAKGADRPVPEVKD